MVDPSISVLPNAAAALAAVNWANEYHVSVRQFMPVGLRTGEAYAVRIIAYCPLTYAGATVGRDFLIAALTELEAWLGSPQNANTPTFFHRRNAMMFLRGMVASMLVANGDTRPGVAKLVADLGQERIAICYWLLSQARNTWTRAVAWNKDGVGININVPSAIPAGAPVIDWAALGWAQ